MISSFNQRKISKMYFGRLLVTLGLIDVTLSARVFGIKVCFCKVGRAFPVVISSEFRMEQYRDDDHREDAPHFTLTVEIKMNFSPCSWKTIESLNPRWVFIVFLTVSCKTTENSEKRDPMRFFPASYFNWSWWQNGDIVTRISDTVTIGHLILIKFYCFTLFGVISS